MLKKKTYSTNILLSSAWKNKNISDILKRQGAKVSRIIMWVVVLNLKPRSVTKAFPHHCKSTKCFHVSQPELQLGRVKKIDILGHGELSYRKLGVQSWGHLELKNCNRPYNFNRSFKKNLKLPCLPIPYWTFKLCAPGTVTSHQGFIINITSAYSRRWRTKLFH